MIDKKLQAKYDECVDIVEAVHNAVGLMLALDPDSADKKPIDIVSEALDNYKEFKSLPPEELALLAADAENIIEQLQQLHPDLEVVDDRINTKISTKKNEKKGLLN